MVDIPQDVSSFETVRKIQYLKVWVISADTQDPPLTISLLKDKTLPLNFFVQVYGILSSKEFTFTLPLLPIHLNPQQEDHSMQPKGAARHKHFYTVTPNVLYCDINITLAKANL